MSQTCQWFVFALVFASFILVENRSYNNGLIFYDLQTYLPYLPPTVSVSRGRGLSSVKYSDKGSIWSTFGKPCECSGIVCGCCAGIKVKQYNFDQKMCANMTFVPAKEEAQLEVFLNEKSSAKYGVSARNPTPFCIPVMMGIPMAMCVQMSDIGLQGNNLNMCMDFVVRLATTDLFEMHFQCMRMGLDGVQYLDKNGQPVIPPSNSKTESSSDYEYYDETADTANEISNYEAEKGSEVTIDEYAESENVGEEEDLIAAMEEPIEEQFEEVTEEIKKELVKNYNEGLVEKENEELAELEKEEIEEKADKTEYPKETENLKSEENEETKGENLLEEKVVEEPVSYAIVAEIEKSTTAATPTKATTVNTKTEVIDAMAITSSTTTTTTTTTESNLPFDASHNSSDDAANVAITTAAANIDNGSYKTDNGNDDGDDDDSDVEEGEGEEEEYDESDDEAEPSDMDTTGYSEPILVNHVVTPGNVSETSVDTQLPIIVPDDSGDLVAMASATVADATSESTEESGESNHTSSSDEATEFVSATVAPAADDIISFYRRRLYG